jgi:DtxR family transcriptional regulator, iron-dependent repressor
VAAHRAPASSVLEDYLLAIYSMVSEGRPVIAARLAESLGVTPPTVTATVGRLRKEGLVEAGGRREIELTTEGLARAEFLVRRHHLAERFLADVLDVPWSRVHEEAHQLEHGISPDVEQRLAAWLGHPTTCPHGNPLPGAAEPPNLVALDRLEPGTRARLDRVLEQAEDDESFLEFLDRNGLRPGACLRLVRVESFNQALCVQTDGVDVILGARAAANIWVQPLPESSAG